MAANPSIQLGTDGNWAIKEDNLLAYKKDGDRFFNKEFDFTRGSLATFVDKDGLIKYSGVTDTELITNGNFDTDSDWTLTGATISQGKLNVNSSSPVYIVQNNVATVGKQYKVELTVSNYVEGDLRLRYPFTISESEFTGNGTYVFYGTADDARFELQGRFSGQTYNYSIDNVSVVEIQTDVPRIDFTDDATGHLLLEPQSTNLVTYSEDFSSLDIRNNAVVTSSAIVSPSGLLDADEITFDGTYSGRVQQAISSIVGESYTISLYLKNKDLSDKTQVWIGFSAATQGGYVTITDEWQRYSITVPADGIIEYPRIQFSGTGSLYAWGFQAEQLSYATSYIPTYGTSRTRNRDLFGQIDFVNEIKNATNFSFFYETSIIEQPANDNDSFRVYGDLGSQTMGEYQQTNNRVYYADSENNTRIISVAVPYTPNVPHKVAWQVNNSDLTIKLFVNGVLIRTATLLEAFVLDYYRLGSTETTLKYNSLAMFPTVLTDGEAYLLTVTQYQSYQEMATALNYTL